MDGNVLSLMEIMLTVYIVGELIMQPSTPPPRLGTSHVPDVGGVLVSSPDPTLAGRRARAGHETSGV